VSRSKPIPVARAVYRHQVTEHAKQTPLLQRTFASDLTRIGLITTLFEFLKFPVKGYQWNSVKVALNIRSLSLFLMVLVSLR